jgi:hypothetical protein
MKRMNARLLGSLLLLGASSTYSFAAAQDFNDTYQQTCELPSTEWATFGTRLTGRMYTRRAAYLNGSLYAAGYLKSTNDPTKENYREAETDEDFCLTGPYHQDDPTGFYGKVVCQDLTAYSKEYGSFAQFEVGVVKIDASTGEPEDIFVYYGEGQDETSGLAVKEINNGRAIMAVSGHFVGSLTADHRDGSQTTLYNSNAMGTADWALHPNAIQNGYDDGFVISADGETGDANWMIAYPLSNRDSQTVGVDVDGDGNIYGAGYSCNSIDGSRTDGDETVICDGFVAKFAAKDGAILWEKTFSDLGAAMWIVYDEDDESLYVTGTTSYLGEVTDKESDTKTHKHCNHEVCGVIMRLSAADGTTEWVRTTKGSPRWNIFDNTGDIELAKSFDGPYVYVAMDDIAEDNDVSNLDEGTPYASCKSNADGSLTPEYEVTPFKVMTASDCPPNSTFVPRTDEANAFEAFRANTGAKCGTGHESVDGCVMKYHKYTGLPVWGADVSPVTGLVPSADGESIMIAGYYWKSSFDNTALPSYNGVEGAYNAKLNARSGKGELVQHSGGVGKTRVYDIVGDASGDLYMVGYTQSSVVQWGGSLKTKIIEEGVDQDDDVGTAFQYGKQSTQTGEYQFFAVKLSAEASKAEPPSCIETCETNNNPTIERNSCFIDNVCYPAGETAEIFGRSCLVCDPSKSQTEWSYGSDVGVNSCFIDNACYAKGDTYSYRKSRSELIESECQVCEPSVNSAGWSVKPGFRLARGAGDNEPPNDCLATTGGNPNLRPSSPPPASNPTTRPVGNNNNNGEGFTGMANNNNNNNNNGAKIGIGIGIGVSAAVILLGLAMARYCARRGTGIEKDTMKDDAESGSDGDRTQDPEAMEHEDVGVFVN